MTRKTPSAGKDPGELVPSKPRSDPFTTCGGCRFWRERAADPAHDHPEVIGLCTVLPPAINQGGTLYGPYCKYPVTSHDTPACGQGEPK